MLYEVLDVGGGRQDRKKVTCYQPRPSPVEIRLAGLGSSCGPLIPMGDEKWQGGAHDNE